VIKDKKIIVVMPAYNAEKTLKKTYSEIPLEIVDDIILVDDASSDQTSTLAKELGIHLVIHEKNLGYGGNQKTCYKVALERGADIVIMLHPDYQYSPKLISAIAHLLMSGEFDVVLASRILGGRAIQGGMPLYKYIANRFLTLIQNILLFTKISEYHTGYRAFTKEVLLSLNLENNSNDFIFDNQILSQIIYKGFKVGEISCPTKYFPEASSINFVRSLKYGISCLLVSLQFRLSKWGIIQSKLFTNN